MIDSEINELRKRRIKRIIMWTGGVAAAAALVIIITVILMIDLQNGGT